MAINSLIPGKLRIAALLLALLACVTAQAGGDDEERGLGGTGVTTLSTALFSTDEERGLGGTGVVGTITAFGSIWVNGIEIEYDNATLVSIDGEVANVSQLSLGQQVQVSVVQQGDTVFAENIAIVHEVVAPVEAVDNRNRNMTVLGQQVAFAEDAPGTWSQLQVGDVVAVSGFRSDDGTIQATDVARLQGTERWTLRGDVQERDGTLYVGEFSLPEGIDGAEEGRRVELNGSWRDGQPVMNRGEVTSGLPFEGKKGRVLVEGRWDRNGGFRYAGGHLRPDDVVRGDRETRNGRDYLLLQHSGAANTRARPETPRRQPLPDRERGVRAPEKALPERGERPQLHDLRHDFERPPLH